MHLSSRTMPIMNSAAKCHCDTDASTRRCTRDIVHESLKIRLSAPYQSLTFSLTLCGLNSQKTHRGGLGLGGSDHEEAHPCFPCFIQPSFKSTDAGSIYYPLVQLVPSINHSERYNIITYSVDLICYPGSLLVTKMDCMMVEYTAKSTWTV